MIAKLTDPWFEARFIGDWTERGYITKPSIAAAQGIFLWCPCGYGKPDGAAHGLLIPFANPRGHSPIVDGVGPRSRDGNSWPRWTMTGTALDDLSLTPSVDVGSPSCWHGFITNGEVT